MLFREILHHRKMAVAEGLHINKFSGKNYNQWRFQMRCLLTSKGIYGHVTGDDVKPANQGKNLDAWLKADGHAMFLLSSALDYSQITLIENCTSAKEILEKLDTIFIQTNNTNKMIVHDRFHQYQMNPSDTVAQHIAKIENLAQQIKNVGESITDIAIMTKILSSLPQKFRNVRQAWLSLAEEKQTINNLTARLLDEEANLTEVEKNDSALMASSNNNHARYKPRKFNNFNKQNQNRQNNYQVCYNCRIPGHIARNCRRPKSNSSGNRPNSSNNHQGYHTTAFNVTELNYSSNLEDSWIMDSGASAHMSFRREYFASLDTSSDFGCVLLGNQESLKVEGKGVVKIEKYINGKWYDSTINNVLYVPKLTRNLFSEGVITQKAMKIIKQNDTVEIYDSKGLVASAVRESNNLCRLLFRTKINEANVTVNNSLKRWHERLGHINIKTIKELSNKRLVPDLNFTDKDNFFCEACAYGKQHRLPFKNNLKRDLKPGELIYSDLCGPMSTPSVQGARYILLFKDGFSSYRVVYFLKHKSDTLDCFKNYSNLVKNKFEKNIKVLHIDNGSEYCNTDFKNYLSDMGIELETTAPYTPQQNGRSERELRTIMESVRSMLYAKKLPQYLWAEAVNTAVYILNRSTSSQVPNTTALELWSKLKPSLSHARIFGSSCYSLVPDQRRKKLDPKSKKLILVGYEGNSCNYRLFDAETRKITVSRNVIFNEDEEVKFNEKIMPISLEEVFNEDIEEDLIEPVVEDEGINQDVVQEEIPNEDAVEAEEGHYNLRRRDTIQAPLRYVFLAELCVPQNYEEAMNSGESKQWSAAIKDELDSLDKNEVWKVTKLPPGRKPIDSKWVFKLKTKANGEIDRFKARLCAKGFAQKQGIDYKETFSPTTRYDSIRVLLALAAKYNYKMMQFDVKTAFLYGELEEEIYMLPPKGTYINGSSVCKLQKSLYGLKQASRNWNLKFDNFLKQFGLNQCEADKCVYRGTIKGAVVLLILYVDDGLVLSSDQNAMDSVLNDLKQKFEISVGVVSNFVGLEINRLKNGSIFIHQTKYVNEILKRFGFSEISPNSVPADPQASLSVENEGLLDEGEVPYREVVGSLIFAAIVSRPDISYAVGVASRYLAKHSMVQWNGVKRILKYLRGTANYGILYKSNSSCEITGYCDSDFAGDVSTRKSTTGYNFMLCDGVVTWNSQRQSSVCLSTTEAEYVAAAHAAKEAIWLRQLLRDLGETIREPTLLYVDNQSAIRLIQNPEFHKRTKHIDIKFHFIREKVKDRDIEVQYIPSKLQIADIFTKALPKDAFHNLCVKMGMCLEI